jgi:hypothetical protein
LPRRELRRRILDRGRRPYKEVFNLELADASLLRLPRRNTDGVNPWSSIKEFNPFISMLVVFRGDIEATIRRAENISSKKK